MLETIEKLLNLSEYRLRDLLERKDLWYRWHKTYIKWLDEEIQEMKEELKQDNSVYLEDELWDIFWDYICLLNSLEYEWFINKENVYNRCFKKLSERLDGIKKWKTWDEIKKKQKSILLKEHKNTYEK